MKALPHHHSSASLSVLLGAIFSLCVIGGEFSADAASVARSAETKADRESRMAWFHDARFGMFIHWGNGAPQVLEDER